MDIMSGYRSNLKSKADQSDDYVSEADTTEKSQVSS